MKRLALVLLTTMLAHTAQAETARVYSRRAGVEWVTPCYPSVRRGPDGNFYRRRVDCSGDAVGYSDIAVPVDGMFNNAMRKEARHFKVHKGVIRLW